MNIISHDEKLAVNSNTTNSSKQVKMERLQTSPSATIYKF